MVNEIKKQIKKINKEIINKMEDNPEVMLYEERNEETQ